MNSLNLGSHDVILTIAAWFRLRRFDELEKYLDITEQYLQKAKNDFEAESGERLKGLPAKKRQEYYDFSDEDYWQYAEKFPRILRNSFFVSAISLLEYEMNILCNRLKKEQGIRINLSDLRGDILERTKKYFENAGLEFPVRDRTWQEINHYYNVRNCIVHANGLVMELRDNDRKTLVPFIKSKHIISQDNIIEEIALTPEFCKEVIETIQSFLVELEKNINLKLNRKNTTKGRLRGAKPLEGKGTKGIA
ncbi:MAG: hypothetical protein A2144_08530 [Chloroflexi bacterium RBG_16_50_9]|nr:MAG: hypothetical protein A2144_08530 [Chloroflexi bacterium RBG_16_50_9]